MHRPRLRTTLLVCASILVSAAAAGCAGDSGSSDGASDEPRAVRAATDPDTDADLASELGDTATTLGDAGCVFGSYEEEEPNHVDDREDLTWKSFPPTSGNHFDAWASWGYYESEVPDGNAVHNLEHGGVVVWLGTKVDDATRDAIVDLLDDEEKWLVTPRPDLEGLFSAAWALGLSCPPEALSKLGPEATAEALDTWYDTVNSTGSEAEKEVPAFAGAMKEPTPKQDISQEAPF
ncbi:MAG: rane protein [Thermoleophilia bacterium]|jgi:hypothetical protein|nr:rane protein [Thermoleophilia bacterium]